MNHLHFISIAALCSCLLLLPQCTSADTAQAESGMIATVHPLASGAGLAAFRKGGNAIDAAIAAALTLGVVDGHNSGLGGGCFVLIRLASGELVAIDGREMAPAAATRNMFLRDGKADPALSQHGPLAVGVPGALAAYDMALTRHGKLALPTLLEYAADIAERGFAMDRVYAGNLARMADWLRRFPGSREMLLKEDGSVYTEGDILRLPDLARTYRQIAQLGVAWFYRGEFAEQVGDWMNAHGGLITADDFKAYQAKQRQPIISTYRGYQVVGFPPPSSGGIHVAQILNMLEQFELRKLFQRDPPTAHHVIAEAMKLAFADRAHWLGDADYTHVPRGLVDKEYAQTLFRKISKDRVTPVGKHGFPPDWQSAVFGKHTTHISAADAEGNWVAITATVNTSFGSKIVVPGTGIVLNNQMDDFSAQPGVPNAFGLIGAEANAVAPGKRPLSSMSPTIVLKDGKPVLTLGAAGGPKIITQVVLGIVNYIDFGFSLEQSIARRRFHHQWRPNLLLVEAKFNPVLSRILAKRGHQVEFLSSAGITQGIAVKADGRLIGVADPRVPSSAMGFVR